MQKVVDVSGRKFALAVSVADITCGSGSQGGWLCHKFNLSINRPLAGAQKTHEMKIEIKAVTITGAEKPGGLFDEAVDRITLAEDEGKNETDWFPFGGFFWNLNAEIKLHTTLIQYDYDSPPEVDKLDVGIKFRAFECTNEEGDYVDVTFLDEKGREISAEDVLVKKIEDYYFMHAF